MYVVPRRATASSALIPAFGGGYTAPTAAPGDMLLCRQIILFKEMPSKGKFFTVFA
jgi:hypothetical protein